MEEAVAAADTRNGTPRHLREWENVFMNYLFKAKHKHTSHKYENMNEFYKENDSSSVGCVHSLLVEAPAFDDGRQDAEIEGRSGDEEGSVISQGLGRVRGGGHRRRGHNSVGRVL